MITLSWKQITNNSFGRAITTLAQARDVDQTTSYRAGRIWEVAVRECRKADKFSEDAHAKYVVKTKNDKGEEVETMPEGAAEALANELNTALEKTTVDVKVHKLEYSKIKGLSGQEIVALVDADIIDNVPQE